MRSALSAILTIAILTALGYAAWSVYLDPLNRVRREVVLARLHSLPASYLILETDVERAEFVHDSSGFLLGKRYGRANLAVRTHWGFDLHSLKPSDISVVGRIVSVTLSDVVAIETVPDLATWHYHSSRSGLFVIVDFLRHRSIQDDLITTVAAKMPDVPDRDDPERRDRLVKVLNERAVTLFKDTDLTIRFH